MKTGGTLNVGYWMTEAWLLLGTSKKGGGTPKHELYIVVCPENEIETKVG